MIGYLSKETHDIMQMQLHLQDGDFKTYAEKKQSGRQVKCFIFIKRRSWI